MTSLAVTVTSEKRQNHIFGYKFGSNCRRDFKLGLLRSITQGQSYVRLTVTFDLEKVWSRSKFLKKSNFGNYVE